MTLRPCFIRGLEKCARFDIKFRYKLNVFVIRIGIHVFICCGIIACIVYLSQLTVFIFGEVFLYTFYGFVIILFGK